MVDAADLRFMERALLVAERGRGRTSPNPNVGAVVVSPDGVVIGQGAHLAAGGPHAEVIALDQAGPRSRGATLYCTLEPCAHTGRTGPCVERIANAGVARVVTAIRDPNPRVAGKGIAFLRERRVDVTEDVGHDAAARQHAAYFTWMRRGRPFVIAKVAVSRDGFVGRPGERVRLTGPDADRFFQRQRAEVDAIAVGAGTVLADDPLLTARGAFRYRALTRVVFDWRGRVPWSARVFSTPSAGPVIMVTSGDALAAAPDRVREAARHGATIETFDRREIGPVLSRLATGGVLSLLVEGGPALHDAFAQEDLIDRVQWVETPERLERGIVAAAALKRLLNEHAPRRLPLGHDHLIETDVHRID